MSDESVNVSVEQIENGWLKRTTRCGPDGEYNCKTEFSKAKPDLVGGGTPAAKPDGSSALAKAIQLLK